MTSASDFSEGGASVLVLMGTFNGCDWLAAQLESIVKQEGVRTTVSIADDNSTDATWDLLKASSNRTGSISLTRRPTPTGSAGANYRQLFRDADLRTHEFVALADQDDEWAPGKVVRAIEVMHSRRGVAYSGAVLAVWASGKSKVISPSPRMTEADFLFEGGGQGCTMVMEARFFERVQAFCRAEPELVSRLHYHDWLVYLLARAWSEPWCFDASPHIRYRQHASNEIGARGGFGPTFRRLLKIRSGWYRDQVIAACHIYHRAGGDDRFVLDLAERLQRNTGTSRNIRTSVGLAFTLLKKSRRLFRERMLLAACVLAGWI